MVSYHTDIIRGVVVNTHCAFRESYENPEECSGCFELGAKTASQDLGNIVANSANIAYDELKRRDLKDCEHQNTDES